jgi:hypothetical protein
MRITKGLIIADPWIGYILDGTKDWEMRSSGASHRGWFGLIRKGTSAIYGVARLIEVGTPLSPTEMIGTFERHRIPEHMIRSGEVAKWKTPWKLADVRRLDQPVSYRHKSGAVTWVELDDVAIDGLSRQLGEEISKINAEANMPLASAPESDRSRAAATVKVDVSHRSRTLRIGIEWHVGKPGDGVPAKAAQAEPVALKAQPRPAAVTAASRTETWRVIGEVEISEGNIANNHIYLRSFFDRFPADAIGGSNKAMRAKRDVTIEWGGAESVQTDLDGQKKLFRSRGWIGAFYQLHRAKAGDRVVVEEIAPYRYRVSLRGHRSEGGLV